MTTMKCPELGRFSMVFPQFSISSMATGTDSKDHALRSLSAREQTALHSARCVANGHSAHLNTLGMALPNIKWHLTDMAI